MYDCVFGIGRYPFSLYLSHMSTRYITDLHTLIS